MGDTESTITIPQWLARATIPLVIIGALATSVSLRDSVLDHERRLRAVEKRLGVLQEYNGERFTAERGRRLERRVGEVENKIVQLETRVDYNERAQELYGILPRANGR